MPVDATRLDPQCNSYRFTVPYPPKASTELKPPRPHPPLQLSAFSSFSSAASATAAPSASDSVTVLSEASLTSSPTSRAPPSPGQPTTHHRRTATSQNNKMTNTETSPIPRSAATAQILRNNLRDSGIELHGGSARSSMDGTSTRDAAGSSSRTSLESGRTSMSADWPVHPGEVNTISQLDALPIGTEVTFRARIETQRPLSKTLDFLLLRDQTHSVQGVLARDADNSDFVKWVRKISPESLVQVCGVLKQPPEPIRSATQSHIEVDICSVHLVNPAQNLPFNNYKPPETLRNRVNARILDLRHPANQALFPAFWSYSDTTSRHQYYHIPNPTFPGLPSRRGLNGHLTSIVPCS